MVTFALELPAVFVAVNVYVVVWPGETTFEATPATSPMPLSIVTVVAPVTIQESVPSARPRCWPDERKSS